MRPIVHPQCWVRLLLQYQFEWSERKEIQVGFLLAPYTSHMFNIKVTIVMRKTNQSKEGLNLHVISMLSEPSISVLSKAQSQSPHLQSMVYRFKGLVLKFSLEMSPDIQLLDDGRTKFSGCHSCHLLPLVSLQFLYLSWLMAETPVIGNTLHLEINYMFVYFQ